VQKPWLGDTGDGQRTIEAPLAPTNELEAMVELHSEALTVKQYSEQTIKARRDQFKVFLRWCAGQAFNSPVRLRHFYWNVINGIFIYYRKKNGELLSFRTQHGMLVPLRGWFRWMTREKQIAHNPAMDLELPRVGRCLPKHTLTIDEVESVLDQPLAG
jgi:integrase/recombinase XerD